MMLAILCLCLASTVSAAPSFFHYLPHYAGSRQQVPPSQMKIPFTAGQGLPQPGLTGAYSVEFVSHIVYFLTPFPSHGFIKYSIPQPPGRQSVEVYYPYDFYQQRILTNIPPMTNVPQIPNISPFAASPLPSQDPMQPLQQDQPTQTSQVHL
uniref:Secretory calcium-binding phosphoprotein 5 n=1 Tax=Labrus bergylta TaxID=56723 RepID=A0A3Q3GB17_9LABR